MSKTSSIDIVYDNQFHLVGIERRNGSIVELIDIMTHDVLSEYDINSTLNFEVLKTKTFKRGLLVADGFVWTSVDTATDEEVSDIIFIIELTENDFIVRISDLDITYEKYLKCKDNLEIIYKYKYNNMPDIADIIQGIRREEFGFTKDTHSVTMICNIREM